MLEMKGVCFIFVSMKATKVVDKPLPRSFTRPLTDEDKEFIRQNHTKYTIGALAERLGKSRSRIYCFYQSENIGGVKDRLDAKKQKDENLFDISEREHWLI
jgi:hypothetical protein